MRSCSALAVSLTLAICPSGLLAAQLTRSLCGGAAAVSLNPGQIKGALSASIALADLDGNGTLEILSADTQRYVHVWDANGKRFKNWPQRMIGNGGAFGSPSVGDIDGDGRPDVVATGYFDSTVYAWSASGETIPGFPQQIGTPGVDHLRGAAMLADLNGDAVPDVVVGATQGIVHAFTAPFSGEAPGWPVSAGSNFQITPASTDLDHDGTPEIVLHSGFLNGEVRVVRADGSKFPGWPRSLPTVHVSPVAGDLDGDGTPEVIAAGESSLTAYEADGTPRFSTTIVNDRFSYSSIALGDVTGDGRPEIFIGSDQGKIYGFAGSGALLPGWPVDTGDDLESSPLIVDLDGDGARDVLVLAADGTLHALSAAGSEICPPVALGDQTFFSPAVGDLDGDGLGEVIAATSGGIFRLGLPGPWTPSRAAWPMELANERHTGELP